MLTEEQQLMLEQTTDTFKYEPENYSLNKQNIAQLPSSMSSSNLSSMINDVVTGKTIP
jgi:hypothetical protein